MLGFLLGIINHCYWLARDQYWLDDGNTKLASQGQIKWMLQGRTKESNSPLRPLNDSAYERNSPSCKKFFSASWRGLWSWNSDVRRSIPSRLTVSLGAQR